MQKGPRSLFGRALTNRFSRVVKRQAATTTTRVPFAAFLVGPVCAFVLHVTSFSKNGENTGKNEIEQK